MLSVATSTLVILLIAAFVAGAVDAAIGGGGLIQLPAILIAAPHLANAQALGLNKISSFCGTFSAAVTMVRKVPGTIRALRYVPLAAGGSAMGALCAALLSKELFRPIIIVAMVLVGAFVTLRPNFGRTARTTPRHISPLALTLLVCLAVAGIGFYDGIFGPGTGMFLIITFTALVGTDFLQSAAITKVLNASTNLGALIVFALHGDQLWLLGLLMGAANILGAQVGARFIIAKGAGTVRVLLLCLIVVMAIKLGWDQFSQ